MGRVGTAFRSFFRALGDADFAKQVDLILDGKPATAVAEPAGIPAPAAPQPAAKPAEPVKAVPQRSEALTLLSVLQREARLVDFLKEDIAGYDDAQIGAAVREIHRDASAALERIFSLKPIRTESEGVSVTVPAGYDAGAIRLVGNVSGQPPHSGSLVHAGWQATKVELPEWTGTTTASKVVTPAEVELR